MDDQRLAYIYGGAEAAKKASKKLTTSLAKFPKKINWTKVSYRMGQSLESYLGDCDVLIDISEKPEYNYYETCISGAATVPSDESPERDVEIHVDLSSDLYNNNILATEEYNEYFEKMFTLTFIHELTHSTQYDDKIPFETKGSRRERYLASAFEVDAYSTECAYDMFAYGGKRTKTESYLRYNSVRDRNVFRKFRDMTLEKYTYLRNYK
jgi:hypothetical protein